MRKTLALLFLSVALSQAGVIRVATYPLRHPIKVQKAIAHVVWKVVY